MPYQLWYFVAVVVAVLALFYVLGVFRARRPSRRPPRPRSGTPGKPLR